MNFSRFPDRQELERRAEALGITAGQYLALLIKNELDKEEQPPSYTCPRCGRTSYNSNDVINRYCGYCHIFE